MSYWLVFICSYIVDSAISIIILDILVIHYWNIYPLHIYTYKLFGVFVCNGCRYKVRLTISRSKLSYLG